MQDVQYGQELKELKEHKELQEQPPIQAHREHRVIKDMQGMLFGQVHKVHKAL
jgi:hypothetical protein